MKIGLLGGTFDPFHWGHWTMIEKSREHCGLDEVVVIPCRQSPHKPDQVMASDDLRWQVLQQVTSDRNDVWCSDWELKRKPPSYTVDTVTFFAEQYPDDQLFWIMGDDQWAMFAQWKDPQTICRLADLVVCQRPGYERSPQPEGIREGRIHYVDHVDQDVASSDLREAMARGESIESKVPTVVWQWIKENQLYGYTNVCR